MADYLRHRVSLCHRPDRAPHGALREGRLSARSMAGAFGPTPWAKVD